MDKFYKAITSRTVGTIAAMVIINGVPSVTGMIPENYLPLVNVLLGLLGAYYRVNPRV